MEIAKFYDREYQSVDPVPIACGRCTVYMERRRTDDVRTIIIRTYKQNPHITVYVGLAQACPNNIFVNFVIDFTITKILLLFVK